MVRKDIASDADLPKLQLLNPTKNSLNIGNRLAATRRSNDALDSNSVGRGERGVGVEL